MKTFKLAFLLLPLLFLTSCADDDSDILPVCNQANWVGTYTGTATCDGNAEDATVTITASGTDAIIIAYTISDSISNFTTTYDPLPFDGCDVNISSTVGLSVDADLTGDLLSFTGLITTDSTTSTCVVTGTRN